MTGQTYTNRYHGETAEAEPTLTARVGNVSDLRDRRSDGSDAAERPLAMA